MKQSRLFGHLIVILLAFFLLSASLIAGAVSPRDAIRYAYQLQEQMSFTAGFSPQQRVLLASHMVSGLVDADELQPEVQNLLRNPRPAIWLAKSDTSYQWDTDHWVPSTRNTYTNNNGEVTNWLIEHWDTDSSKWLNVTQYASTYDGNNRLATTTIMMWMTGAWQNTVRWGYTYNGSGLLDWVYTETWTGLMFADHERTAHFYGVGNRIDSTLTERYSGTWVNFGKESWTYDFNNNLTELLTHSWSGTQWVSALRLRFAYNGLNQETEWVDQTWTGTLWLNQYRHESSYNGNGELVLYLTSSWVLNAWSPIEADTSKFSDGKKIETVLYSIGSGDLLKTDYTYDGNGNLILEFAEVKEPLLEWRNSGRTVYVYESALSVLIETDKLPQDFELQQNYPNPFNPTTEIRFRVPQQAHVELIVYNMLGQRVRTIENSILGPGLYAASWDGTDQLGHAVASGIYLYRIRIGDFVQSRKMLLMK